MEKPYTCIAIDEDKSSLLCIKKAMRHSSVFNLSTTFTNFYDAIIFLQTEKVDLILCDIERINDTISYNHLQQFPSNIPIIYITGYYSSVAEICFKAKKVSNIISCACKPFFEQNYVLIEKLFFNYINLELQEKTPKLQVGKDMIIHCHRKDNSDICYKIKVSTIIMIKPCALLRGCLVYALGFSMELFIPKGNLKILFLQLNRDYPHLFISIGRRGIVNIKNVSYTNNVFVPTMELYWYKNLEMQIPRVQQKKIQEIYFNGNW